MAGNVARRREDLKCPECGTLLAARWDADFRGTVMCPTCGSGADA